MLITHLHLALRLQRVEICTSISFPPMYALIACAGKRFLFSYTKFCRIKNTEVVVIYDFQPFLSLGTLYSPQQTKKTLNLYSA
jgi:hypothetical protein